jgi:hypothetical protein
MRFTTEYQYRYRETVSSGQLREPFPQLVSFSHAHGQTALRVVFSVPLYVLDDILEQVRAFRGDPEIDADVREVRVEMVKLRRVMHETP